MKQQTTDPIRIAIAEHSLILRCGIVHALKKIPDMAVHTTEATTPDGLESLLHTTPPDLLIVSPHFGGKFSLDDFRADPIHRQLKCLAIAATPDTPTQGYDDTVTLDDTPESLAVKIKNLLPATHTANSGEPADHESATLSQREKEIVVCVVKGMTNKETAEHLFLSVHTVITHRRNIARKLDIRSSAGLTIYAIVNNLVDISEVKM